MPPEPRLSKGASYKNNPSSKALDKSGKIIKSGLPQNWPKPTDEDLAACPTRIVTFGDSQKLWFNTNFIRTSKYTVLSFFPKFMAQVSTVSSNPCTCCRTCCCPLVHKCHSLWLTPLLQSFHPRKKMANVYFLLIAAMQCVPVISNTMGFPTVLFPLSFVIVVDAIFAILEDLDRHKADDRANATTCLRFNKARKVFEEITWAEVTVGDVCQVSHATTRRTRTRRKHTHTTDAFVVFSRCTIALRSRVCVCGHCFARTTLPFVHDAPPPSFTHVCGRSHCSPLCS